MAPSDKVNVAIVGAGGQGLHNARALFQESDCQVMAVADPAEEWDLREFYYGGRSGRGPVRAEVEEHYRATTPNHSCAAYEDFRVMLEKEKAIDAVLVATPDHLHAYASILAMKAGKHVYCEKPLTHNVWEARAMARVAAETGVATQMGNQGRSGEGHRQTAEWIADGAIGAVREVHAWCGSMGSLTWTTRPEGTPKVPRGLNWDLWLGPRPPVPTIPPTRRARGAASGPSAAAPCRTWPSTTSTPLSTRSTSRPRRRWKPRRPGSTPSCARTGCW